MLMQVSNRSLGNPNKVSLVLLHGWGCSAEAWQPLLDQLCENFYVHLLALPGYDPDDEMPAEDAWQPEVLVQAFREAVPFPAIWCGWSLGGMLATYYAACEPERVKGLIAIASNPVFVAQPGWPQAMPLRTFSAFANDVDEQPRQTLGRFLGLVTQGSPAARADLRQLRALLGPSSIDPAVLSASLDLLGRLDVREAVSQLILPQLHLLGEQDGLVPVGAAPLIGDLNADAEVSVVQDASHIPWLSHADNLICRVISFCEKHGLFTAD